MESPPTDVRFVHTPLNFKNREIRLLTIEPSSDPESPIQITIKHIDFSSHVHALTGYQEEKDRLKIRGRPRSEWNSETLYNEFSKETLPFVALSYTWGSEFPAQDILVTSPECRGWLSVRQNLYEFLKTRRTCDSTWFWIDQICINQGKDDEKTHQVNQMAEIYSAAAVEVWLGSEFEGSDKLIDLIVRESVLSTQKPRPKLSVDKHGFSTHIPCLQRLMSNPYWSRLWITQEIVLGKVVDIRVGSKTLPWDAFYSGWRRVDDAWASMDDASRVDEFDRQDRLWAIERMRNYSFEIDWWDIWSLSSGSECSDSRDLVFGTMGMLRPSLRILPDYSMQPQDVLLMLLPKIVEAVSSSAKWDFPSGLESRSTNRGNQEYCMMTVWCWIDMFDNSVHKISQRLVRRHLLKILLSLDPPKFGCRTGKVCLLKYRMWHTMGGRRRLKRKLPRLGRPRWRYFRSTKEEEAEPFTDDGLFAESDVYSLSIADSEMSS